MKNTKKLFIFINPRGLPAKYVNGPRILLSITAITLYLPKNIKISSNKIAKLGHRSIIQIGNKPKYKDV